MLDVFSQYLKNEREKAGVTLQQIAIKTRIDLKFLQSIENGDFSFLPELYIRAFVKQYASNVGLDPDLTLKKFEAAKEGKPIEDVREEEKSEVIAEEKPKVSRQSKKTSVKAFDATVMSEQREDHHTSEKKKKLVMFGIVAAVIAIVALVIVFSTRQPEIIVKERPIEEIVEDARRYYEEPVQTEALSEDSVTEFGDSLSLVIRSSDTAWVKIILDNTTVNEFTLFPNSSKTILASDNYKITFGRSRGISLTLNNQPLEFIPRTFPVSHIQINREGLIFLNSPPTVGQ